MDPELHNFMRVWLIASLPLLLLLSNLTDSSTHFQAPLSPPSPLSSSSFPSPSIPSISVALPPSTSSGSLISSSYFSPSAAALCSHPHLSPSPTSSPLPSSPSNPNTRKKVNAPNGESKVNDPDPDPDPSTPKHPMLLFAVKVVLLAVIVGLYIQTLLASVCYTGSLLLPFVPWNSAGFGVDCYPGPSRVRVRARAAIQRAVPSHLAARLLGSQVEPHGNQHTPPHRILPVLTAGTHLLGRRKEWAPLPAVFATFLVSGLMHEVIYFYLTRVEPTWEVTWFFVLQGVCTAAELVVKKAVAGSRWRLHRAVSGFLTLGFAAVTGA